MSAPTRLRQVVLIEPVHENVDRWTSGRSRTTSSTSTTWRRSRSGRGAASWQSLKSLPEPGEGGRQPLEFLQRRPRDLLELLLPQAGEPQTDDAGVTGIGHPLDEAPLDRSRDEFGGRVRLDQQVTSDTADRRALLV